MRRTLLTLACLGLAIQRLYIRRKIPKIRLRHRLPPESVITPAAVEANLRLFAVPEDARRVRLNIHFDNKSTAIRSGNRPGNRAIRRSSLPREFRPFEPKPGDGNIFSTDAVLQGDRDYTVDYIYGPGRSCGQPQRAVSVYDRAVIFYASAHDRAPHDGLACLTQQRQNAARCWRTAETAADRPVDLRQPDFFLMREIKANWRIETCRS